MRLAFVLLSGLLALVLLATLLLVGVTPGLVFAPGLAIKSWGTALGFRVPNAVGVLSTGLLYWGAIMLVWVTVAKAVRRRTGQGS